MQRIPHKLNYNINVTVLIWAGAVQYVRWALLSSNY